MGKQTVSNDATTKLLGYDYQKLIALEYCLNAKKNDTIWIECKGDVATTDTSTEVKLHIDGGNIASNSVDVWKTIKNYVVEYNIIEQFNFLVLHTTSICQNDSIFYKWNNLTAQKKRERLIIHTPVKTIEEFHKTIIAFEEANMLKILSMFTILEGQKSIKEKWDELKEHSKFTIIPESFRDAALEQLYGYITKKAIDNSKEWKITINDFNRDIQDKLSQYTKGNTPFPSINVNEIGSINEQHKFAFIEKMKCINIKAKDQTNAIQDYMRANLSQIKLLETTPTLNSNLETYDTAVLRAIEDEKSKNSLGIIKENLNTDNVDNISQKTYFDCITKTHDSIIGVDNTEKYYRDGRIHHTLEETDFEWKYNEFDI